MGGAQREPITTVSTTRTSVCRVSLPNRVNLSLPVMSRAANVGVKVCGF